MDEMLLLGKLNIWVLSAVIGVLCIFVFISRLTHFIFNKYIKKFGKKSLLNFIYINIKWMIPLFYTLIYLAAIVHVLRIGMGIDLDATAKKSIFSHYAPLVAPIFESLILVWFTVFVVRIINGIKSYVLYLSQSGKNTVVDVDSVNLISRSIQVVIILFVGIGILGVFGQDISSLLAVGGVGTIVIGFAAQNTLANLFGGLYIMTDRPFVEGQWIRSPDRNFEGVVEFIGWRITKIRTFTKTVLYVPNTVFSTVMIENVSRMSHRRIQEVLTIRYDDAARMKLLVKAIREYIDNCKDVDQNMYKSVNFNAMADCSLNIRITCFVFECASIKYNIIKEKVLFDMIDIVHGLGCDFAYPTQTIFLPENDKSD